MFRKKKINKPDSSTAIASRFGLKFYGNVENYRTTCAFCRRNIRCSEYHETCVYIL